MRGSSNVRKYIELVRATPVEGTSEYSRDYRASVIDTLEWMLGERKERPIAIIKIAGVKAVETQPVIKPVAMRKASSKTRSTAARAFSKQTQVKASA